MFAFFAVVNFVDELSVPVAAYISFNRESGELPMSSLAQIGALPQVRAEPPMP